MKQIKKLLNKTLGIKRGKIEILNQYESGVESITPPICEDINGDEQIETIITNTKGELIVFTEDYKQKWKYTVKEEITQEEEMFLDHEISNSINHQPLITNFNEEKTKTIIFGTEYGTVYALNHEGKELWKYHTGHPIRGGINTFQIQGTDKKGIMFGSTDKYIHILSQKGKLLRKLLNNAEIESTPTMINNNIIFGDNRGNIKSIDLKGRVNWTYQTNDKITAKPIQTELYNKEKALLISAVDNNLYCLTMTGELIWKFETKGAIYSEPSVLDINEDSLNEIIIGSADGNIYVLTMQGNQLWSFETDFWILGKPITRDLNKDGAIELVIGSYDNNIYVLSGKGIYIIEYVPGVAGIVAQHGNYSDIPATSPGEIIGDKLWDYNMGGLVIGCALLKNKIVAQTKEGKTIWLNYEEGK